MIVLPAIDLRQGHVVRLRQGCGDAQTVYDDDPIAVARHWAGQGATWLHVVDLDGALSAGMPSEKIPPHVRRLQALCTAVSGVSVQFGGGLRSLPAIARALEAGAARVVLGTVAVQQPALLREALARFGPERVAVAIDVRAGRVTTHGWRHDAPLTAVAFGQAAARLGVLYAVYTDVQRDGMLCGVDAAAAAELARRCGLRVIASGGVAALDDVRRLRCYEAVGVVGVVVGQALYAGALSLAAAIRAAEVEQVA